MRCFSYRILSIFNMLICSFPVVPSCIRCRFNRAFSFTSDLSNWNTAECTTLHGMFGEATAFNSDLSNWNVEKVTSLQNFVLSTSAFNSNLSTWNVANVNNIVPIAQNAAAFNQVCIGFNCKCVYKFIMLNQSFSIEYLIQDLCAWNDRHGRWLRKYRRFLCLAFSVWSLA